MAELSMFWAKDNPFQSVITHGEVSGIVAQVLLEEYLADGCVEQLLRCLALSREELVRFIGYYVSIHDIGKIAYFFQAMQTGYRERLKECGLAPTTIFPKLYRHEKMSQQYLKALWREQGIEKRTADLLAEILGAHHQGKTGGAEDINEQNALAMWDTLRRKFEEQMRLFFCKKKTLKFPAIKREDGSIAGALLLGLVILADWIASGELFANAEGWNNRPQTVREKTKQFLRESGLCCDLPEFGGRFSEVWQSIPKGSERELQKKTEALFEDEGEKTLLVLMEAPMGEGKTEAGVYAALKLAKQWGKKGFYIGLPTAATSNQMVSRMQNLLQQHESQEKVKLLHAMAWMVDEGSSATQRFSTQDEAYAHEWLLPLRRGMLAPYAVGTVDQCMIAAMFVKYGVLRLLGLAGKVLIIDEMHAYDLYMQNILTGLLQWCKALEIPVVILSATLPPAKKRELLSVYTDDEATENYPAISAVDCSGKLRVIPFSKVAKRQTFSIQLLPVLNQAEKIAESAVQTVAEGGCLCVLLNTVAQTQAVYRPLKKTAFDGVLLLFHAQFPMQQRDEIEKTCIQLFGKQKEMRPKKAILVATQVCEQSLDLDFDFFFSAVAPIDLLLQRMGREYRHENTPRPEKLQQPTFTVLIPVTESYGVDAVVYPECLLKQSVNLLKKRETVSVPEDMQTLVAQGYDADFAPQEEIDKWMEHLVEEQISAGMAEKYKLGSPKKKFRPLYDAIDFDDLEQQSYLSVQTRLSEPYVRVALLKPELYRKISALQKEGEVEVSDKYLAQEIFAQSVSVRKKKCDKYGNSFTENAITGKRLLANVTMLPAENPCIAFDKELGVVWKEETECM